MLKNIFLSILSIIIFVIIAEILTRIFWHPTEKNKDVRKGLVLEGANRTLNYEGIVYQINSHGIRNRDSSTEKDTNTIRIMALGDSFIWGDGQNNKDLVTVKLENLLNKRNNHKRHEVINTGIGGYNTRDEFKQLIRLYPIYKPNFVIQFFFTNDVLDTKTNNEIRDLKVVYHMWLRKNSKFYSLFYYLIKSTINAEVSFPQFLLPQDYYNLDDTKPGWVDFKTHTMSIMEFCKEQNIGYMFVFIPTLTNLDDNYPYMEIKNKVENYVDSLNAPFLSYFNLFSKHPPKSLWVSEENTHWNGFATTLAADTLAQFLINKKLITK